MFTHQNVRPRQIIKRERQALLDTFFFTLQWSNCAYRSFFVTDISMSSCFDGTLFPCWYCCCRQRSAIVTISSTTWTQKKNNRMWIGHNVWWHSKQMTIISRLNIWYVNSSSGTHTHKSTTTAKKRRNQWQELVKKKGILK